MRRQDIRKLPLDVCRQIFLHAGRWRQGARLACIAMAAQALHASPALALQAQPASIATVSTGSFGVPTAEASLPPQDARENTAEDLQTLYRNATRRGATLEARYALQEAVYPGKTRTSHPDIIDGDIGSGTQTEYARMALRLGVSAQDLPLNAVLRLGLNATQNGQQNYAPQRAVYQTQFAAESSCPAGYDDFAGTVCFGQITSIGDLPKWRSASRYHFGTDVFMPIGTPITLPTDGVVVAAEPVNGHGNQMSVAFLGPNDEQCMVLMSHLQESLLSRGARVQRGQRIAISGRSGIRNSASHTHVELICRNDFNGSLYAPNIAHLMQNGGLGAQQRFNLASYNVSRVDRDTAFFFNRSPQVYANLPQANLASNDSDSNAQSESRSLVGAFARPSDQQGRSLSTVAARDVGVGQPSQETQDPMATRREENDNAPVRQAAFPTTRLRF